MRYGNPSTEKAIKSLQSQGCEKIIFFPLYPQYAGPTTATANDQAFRSLMKLKWQPAFRTVPAYFENETYLFSLSNSIKEAYKKAKTKPDHLVVSYHGVPERYLMAGDPYHCQCQKTTRLLAERLKWDKAHFTTTFQSKFGPEKWVGPSTVDYVADLAKNGKKNIAIIAPAFSSDCVETLDEINEEIAESFSGSNFKWSSRQEERNKLWKNRHNAFYAVKSKYPEHNAIATDACVPISELANLIDQTAKDIEESGIPGPIWGHVGDGNFHATLLIKKGNLKEKKIAQSIIHRMCERSLELGGTVTGEHGIGMGKLNFMEKEHGYAWDIMTTIKKTLDPNLILNPGKVIKSN